MADSGGQHATGRPRSAGSSGEVGRRGASTWRASQRDEPSARARFLCGREDRRGRASRLVARRHRVTRRSMNSRDSTAQPACGRRSGRNRSCRAAARAAVARRLACAWRTADVSCSAGSNLRHRRVRLCSPTSVARPDREGAGGAGAVTERSRYPELLPSQRSEPGTTSGTGAALLRRLPAVDAELRRGGRGALARRISWSSRSEAVQVRGRGCARKAAEAGECNQPLERSWSSSRNAPRTAQSDCRRSVR